MTAAVFIFLLEGGHGISHAMKIDNARNISVSVSIDMIANEATGTVIGVLAGEDVSTWALALPALSDTKLRQILPSQLEDYKAVTQSSDHYALLGLQKDGTRLVACVGADVMRRSVVAMGAVGIVPDIMVPDYFLLPTGQETLTSIASPDQHRIYARLPDGTGFAGDRLLINAVASGAKQIDLDLLEQDIAHFTALSLMQDTFRPRAAIAVYIPLMRRSGVLALMALMLWGASLFITAQRQVDEADQLRAESESLFKATFPSITRIIDMEAQARRAVSLSRKADGNQFLTLSEAVFAAIAKSDTAILEGLRFNEEQNSFFLTVSFGSFSSSDGFLGELGAAGLKLTEGGSRQEDGRVITDIALEVTQ